MKALTAALCVALTLAFPAVAGAYDWPVKPFDEQHAVRGSFDDPRTGTYRDGSPERSFHSGIDIVAPDGSPVYAIEPGWVSLRVGAVTVVGHHVFGYWHVHGTVRSGQHVRRHQLLGFVERGFAHVHLSESVNGVYLNPLRPGGIAPYVDTTAPTIDDLEFVSDDRTQDILDVSGMVDIIADAYDTPPIAPPGVWSGARWTPALLRWRIVGSDGPATPWRTAIDFRFNLLPSSLYPEIFAPGTFQNRPSRPGDYRFFLAHAFDTRQLQDGVYTLEVMAHDMRGNASEATLPFRIVNGVLR